jgi:predicted GNAT family acetyltransferase
MYLWFYFTDSLMTRNYITEENRIYLPDENWNILAEIDFEQVDDKTYNISHTFVDDSLRGQGIGSELVEKAITYLTAKWYQVSATCPYAKKEFK